MPTSLPVSCLTMAPRLDMLELYNRKPLSEMDVNNGEKVDLISSRKLQSPRKMNKTDVLNESQKYDPDINKMLQTLKELLGTLLKSKSPKEMASSGKLDPLDPTPRTNIPIPTRVDKVPLSDSERPRPYQIFLQNSGTHVSVLSHPK